MTTRGPVEPDDLALVADTDALLDALAAGGPPAPSVDGELDTPAALLSAWRAELDEHAATAMTASLTVPAGGARYWVRTHRKTAAATALVVALAGSTGVAAAASGPTGPLGPLHKLFFNDSSPAHRLDPLAAAAARLLDSAQEEIEAAQSDESIAPAVRDRIAAELDEADAYLQRDTLAPAGLAERLNHLRTELARIPLASDDGSTPDADDHRGHGSDDSAGHDGDDRSGNDVNRDSGKQSGDDEGADDGSQDGGDRGEDDGGDASQLGDDQSGGDSGDESSSGSDDGSSSSDDESTGSGGEDADGASSDTYGGEDTEGVGIDGGGSGSTEESHSGE